MLSQAILQAQAIARQSPEAAVPVAVAAAERVPASVAEQVIGFAARHAPEVAVGIIDSEGFRAFAGHGLEVLNAEPAHSVRRRLASTRRLPQLFSDLNQWMLKILLAQSIPESLLSAPRARFRNATELAQGAKVSVMTAFRFVTQLEKQGFLDERGDCLRIVRSDELLERWVGPSQQGLREFPARGIIRRDPHQLLAAVERYVAALDAASPPRAKPRSGRLIKAPPRICIGLFAAAHALGVGFVHGPPPHIYLERLDLDVLEQLGLTMGNPESRIDAYIRVPANREAVFRPAVRRDGLPVSDVLQVWLDVSTHAARGQEQAGQIRRRVLGPLFGRK
jgi:hypothetical protein